MVRKSLSRAAKLIGRVLAVAFTLTVVVMILPSKARSQLGLDPCCAIISAGLSTISNLLSSVVANPLGQIQQLEQQSANFEQQVVFPLTAINQARGSGHSIPGAIYPDAPDLPASGIERNPAHATTA